VRRVAVGPAAAVVGGFVGRCRLLSVCGCARKFLLVSAAVLVVGRLRRMSGTDFTPDGRPRIGGPDIWSGCVCPSRLHRWPHRLTRIGWPLDSRRLRTAVCRQS
jgi:hypothetical protein